MTLVSLKSSLPDYDLVRDPKPHLQCGDVQVYQLDEVTFQVTGYSVYEELPRTFSFSSEIDVFSVLVPFLMQCIDGLERI